MQWLSCYWQIAVWRNALRQMRQARSGTTAAEVAFVWLVGLAGASFALLQWGYQQTWANPPAYLRLGWWLPLLLPADDAASAATGTLVTVAIATGAGLCFWVGTGKLAQAVSMAYGNTLKRRNSWRQLLVALLLTVLLWLAVSLALAWVGPPPALAPALSGDLLKLSVAEGQIATAPPWRETLWQVVRWPMSLLTLASALALVYRFAPHRWSRGMAILPGVGLGLGLGAMVLGLTHWGLAWLAVNSLKYGVYLNLATHLLVMYWLIWLGLLGAQFNGSLPVGRSGGGYTFGNQRVPPPPPSFDSFKINRNAKE
jgi:hypothetical protein